MGPHEDDEGPFKDEESLLKRGHPNDHHRWVSLISAITWLAFCKA